MGVIARDIMEGTAFTIEACYRVMMRVSHIVNSVFTSRTYVLSRREGREFWIVDCGDVPPLVDMISAIGVCRFS